MSDVADPLSSFAPASAEESPNEHLRRAKVLSAHLKAVPAATASSGLTAVLFLFLFLPPVVMAVVSVWAGVTGVRALWDAAQLLASWQIGSVGTLLPSLDAASRLALLGVSFFALLFALIVFMGGTFGRGWRHLFLVPAVILATPSLVVFVQSARMTSVLLSQLGVSHSIQVLGFVYLFLDALLLALLLTDARPRRHRMSRRSRPLRRRESRPLGGEASASENISELPYVRFSLSNPFDDTLSEEPAEKAVEAEPRGEPTEATA